MKLKTTYYVCLLLSISYIQLQSCYYNNSAKKQRIIDEQVGVYKIDLRKTDLGKYVKDSNSFKNLSVEFKADLTFNFNMKVPFIYDSTGNWIPSKGGVEDWNWIYYSNSKISTQFTEPYGKDSIFCMNSVTPQKGEIHLQKIYFKKLNTH